MKQVITIFFLAICLLSQSCHFGTSGTWKNGRIDEQVRNDIHVLNKKLFKAIASKDTAAIKQMMSPGLAEKSSRFVDTLVSTYSTSFTSLNYAVSDEYYTKNTNANIPNTIISYNGSNLDYKIEYLALNEEMYTSVLISKSFPVSVMVLAIYGKYDNGWKLNIIRFGDYSILNKTAPDYYNAALNYDKQGNIIDAAGMIVTASQIGNPGGSYFKYKNEGAMKDLYKKVLQEADAKYLFPIDVDKVKTKPQIFAITPQLIDGGKDKGIFPIIKYKSTIPLADTVALKAENKAMQQIIGGLFKGIDVDNSHIIYHVFNQIPDGTNVAKRYGFLQTTGH